MATPSGHYNAAFITPTSMLADKLRPVIEDATRNVDNASKNGGMRQIAQRTADTYIDRNGKKNSVDSIYRRIYDIMQGRTTATRIELADAILLSAHILIEQTDLPTLPAGMKAAREMIDIRCDMTGEKMTLPKKHAAARSLYDFSMEFIREPCEEKWAEAPELLREAG